MLTAPDGEARHIQTNQPLLGPPAVRGHDHEPPRSMVKKATTATYNRGAAHILGTCLSVCTQFLANIDATPSGPDSLLGGSVASYTHDGIPYHPQQVYLSAPRDGQP